MPDTDKILEAERSIQSIASELTRMRDAANILQGAQEQVDAVLKSAGKVIEVTEKFSNECGVIVTKLAATDLNQRLDGLQTLHGELGTAADSIKEKLRSVSSELQSGIQTASDHVGAEVKTGDARLHSDIEQLAALINEQTRVVNNAIANIDSRLGTIENQLKVAHEGVKKRQIVTIVVMILTFLATLFLLVKGLVHGL